MAPQIARTVGGCWVFMTPTQSQRVSAWATGPASADPASSYCLPAEDGSPWRWRRQSRAHKGGGSKPKRGRNVTPSLTGASSGPSTGQSFSHHPPAQRIASPPCKGFGATGASTRRLQIPINLGRQPLLEAMAEMGCGHCSVPSQRGESCPQNSADQADSQLLEIGLLAAISHHHETAHQYQNGNGCRE